MPTKPTRKRKAKDTPAKQHARFVEAAKEAGLPDDPKTFDKAFKSIVSADLAQKRNRRA